MRIVFIGTVEFSRRCLVHLLERKAEIVGVITKDDTGFNADYADLQSLADEAGVLVLKTGRVNDPATLDWVRERNADVIFCFGWSNLLKKEILEMTRFGVVGFHPAALPANRGRHPLIWALARGLQETATTFFFMDEGADSGDILSQKAMPIGPDDDASSLYEKMALNALEQIDEFLPRLADGTYERQPQDHSRANTWRKRGKADGEIDWRMSADSVVNLIRALTRPYPGAHFVSGDSEVIVWRAAKVAEAPENLEPGKVIGLEDEGPVVKCGEGTVQLLETEPSFNPHVGQYL